MKTPREQAHAAYVGTTAECLFGLSNEWRSHSIPCDRLTAAITERDAEHEREFDKLYDDCMSVAAERDRLRLALEDATRALGDVPCDHRCFRGAHEGQAAQFGGPAASCQKTIAIGAVKRIARILEQPSPKVGE